jgi:hypothetical protein
MPVEYPARVDRSQGNWYPACGGTETAFRTRGGHLLLYCWQPSTGKHAYLNVETDIILTDEEARATLATY